jgi:hypothetical protein
MCAMATRREVFLEASLTAALSAVMLLGLVTAFTACGIMIGLGHIDTLPFVSDCGVQKPERFVFRSGFGMCAAALLALLPAVQAATDPRSASRVVAWATRGAQLGALGLTFVAAASEVEEYDLHITAAGIFFTSMGLWMPAIAIAYGGNEKWSRLRLRFRLTLSVLYAVSFIVMGASPLGSLNQRIMEWLVLAILVGYFTSLRPDVAWLRAGLFLRPVADPDATREFLDEAHPVTA